MKSLAVFIHRYIMTERKKITKRKRRPWAWRPSKKTDITIQKLEYAFSIDCTVEEACYYADISTSTYHNYVTESPKLLDRFNALRNKPVLTAREEVVKGMKNNPELALKYLERKRKAEFSLRKEVTWEDWWPIEQIVSYNIPDNDRG